MWRFRFCSITSRTFRTCDRFRKLPSMSWDRPPPSRLPPSCTQPFRKLPPLGPSPSSFPPTRLTSLWRTVTNNNTLLCVFLELSKHESCSERWGQCMIYSLCHDLLLNYCNIEYDQLNLSVLLLSQLSPRYLRWKDSCLLLPVEFHFLCLPLAEFVRDLPPIIFWITVLSLSSCIQSHYHNTTQ